MKKLVKVLSGETFTIEKNVPIRGAYRSPKMNLKYPLDQMDVNDSFEVKEKDDICKELKKISSACIRYGRKSGKRFTVLRTGESTIRVWRLS